MKIEGGCLCGKVRYSGEPSRSLSAYAIVRPARRAQERPSTPSSQCRAGISTNGTVQTHTGGGAEHWVAARRFFRECGSPVAVEAEVMPDTVMIPLGTLDDKSGVRPAMQIYCDSAQPWVMLEAGIQRFPKMPMPGG